MTIILSALILHLIPYALLLVALTFPGLFSNHEHSHSFTDPVTYKSMDAPVFWNVMSNSLQKLRNFRKNLLPPPFGAEDGGNTSLLATIVIKCT